MHDPPAYVWAIIIAGPTAIAATTCIALYAVIAGHRWYPHAAVVSGPGGRVPGHAASAQPDAGGGARFDGSGHG